MYTCFWFAPVLCIVIKLHVESTVQRSGNFVVLICRHVMNELLETERAYVEELLCVLQVRIKDTFSTSVAMLIVAWNKP